MTPGERDPGSPVAGAGRGGETRRSIRTVGVEEELLLVARGSGRALSMASQVLARAGEDVAGTLLEKEFQEQQIETDSRPHRDLAALEEDLRGLRRTAGEAAQQAGARIAALGTCALPVVPHVVKTPRYTAMMERYGLTATEYLICGCHVHVSVDSDEEAVGVLDRIRVWLPSLLALSANSPFWQGQDSGYDSYRSLVLYRWPSAGPQDVFGSAAAYRSLVDRMVDSGVLLDRGMVYFDARASYRYPTVEIRVGDVCLDVSDTVLLAALGRGLVETAARELTTGAPPPPVPATMLRLATWQAARDGLGGDLLDPVTGRPRPAVAVLGDLVEHVRPALRDLGDEALVEERLEQVLSRGNGATRQRAVLERTGDLADVVADAVRVTAGQDG